jgi:hypothetical protein
MAAREESGVAVQAEVLGSAYEYPKSLVQLGGKFVRMLDRFRAGNLLWLCRTAYRRSLPSAGTICFVQKPCGGG